MQWLCQDTSAFGPARGILTWTCGIRNMFTSDSSIDELIIDLEALRNGEPPVRARARFDVSMYQQLGDGEAVEPEEDIARLEIAQRYRMVLLLLGTIAGVAILIIIILLAHLVGR